MRTRHTYVSPHIAKGIAHNSHDEYLKLTTETGPQSCRGLSSATAAQGSSSTVTRAIQMLNDLSCSVSVVRQGDQTILKLGGGDSLMRHAMQGLHILIRGDVGLGGLREDIPNAEADLCKCDNQFQRPCRNWVMYEALTGHTMCPAASVTFIGAFDDQYKNRAARLGRLAYTEVLAGRNLLMLLGGWGMHNGLQAKPIFQDLILPVWKEVQKAFKPVASVQSTADSNGPRLHNAKLLCVGVTAVQSNLPEQYKIKQNNWKVQQYNSDLARLCSSIGIPFFDPFALSLNASSFDGIHYGLQVNVLRAQLLLNFIARVKW
ncbi:hypothetical protein CEUSTIGMA_g11467.t1 [Chlamydomonas eustigma]|uniref:Sialate O-acetylesterase domain-containing protein n=1 Tax=Chlamydomonas eustigma TaxID=1157962 RepID=A0A250XLY4_9CHLO|nr:hypothetical protein CEUSTIGMA_g11467.t1 [Chlamydomonas eustigma]|eukprot:GAX84043.1 hypothetical protein CEUSTIGMA_g11467.t1 [Chlamydomonas eustigma]